MRVTERIALTRDCEAVVIPYGDRVVLPAGSPVVVLQTLGGNFTVETDRGQMVRIDSADADALGRVDEAAAVAVAGAGKPLEEQVWDQLRTTYDPEIPVNIVELGLVYRCDVTPLPEGGQAVAIVMTLTAPGCGMGGVLKGDIERKLATLPGVTRAAVEVVFSPQWNPGMMSEAAKLQLGLL